MNLFKSKSEKDKDVKTENKTRGTCMGWSCRSSTTHVGLGLGFLSDMHGREREVGPTDLSCFSLSSPSLFLTSHENDSLSLSTYDLSNFDSQVIYVLINFFYAFFYYVLYIIK